ncbi:MAG: response regulator [Myxococcales bacterium]|nr:response regulator [Myxococcales bacterium]
MTSIVLVDDEKDLLESLARVLRKEFPNANVRCTIRPVEAREWLLAERPALLITDVRMPEISGLELLSLVSERWGFVPTIIMTAFASPELDEALKLGTFHYLPKPFRNLELVRLVRRLLEEESAKNEPEGFAGTVSVSMLADVVQLHSLAGSSGVLVIDTSLRRGKIFFLKGRIVHAEDGSMEGREAFNQIVSWKSGRFSFSRQLAERETIFAPASELLIDALRLSDESQRDDDELLFDGSSDDHNSALDLMFADPTDKPSEESSFEAFGKALEAFSPLKTEPKGPKKPAAPLAEKKPVAPLVEKKPPLPEPTTPPAKLAQVTSSGSLQIVAATAPIEPPIHEGGYISSSAVPVNNFLESLSQFKDLGGFLGAALCDGAKSLLLASYGGNYAWQDALPFQYEMLQKENDLVAVVSSEKSVRDIILTSEDFFYVMRPCDTKGHIFLVLLLERAQSNLALARITMAEIQEELVLPE